MPLSEKCLTKYHCWCTRPSECLYLPRCHWAHSHLSCLSLASPSHRPLPPPRWMTLLLPPPPASTENGVWTMLSEYKSLELVLIQSSHQLRNELDGTSLWQETVNVHSKYTHRRERVQWPCFYVVLSSHDTKLTQDRNIVFCDPGATEGFCRARGFNSEWSAVFVAASFPPCSWVITPLPKPSCNMFLIKTTNSLKIHVSQMLPHFV